VTFLSVNYFPWVYLPLFSAHMHLMVAQNVLVGAALSPSLGTDCSDTPQNLQMFGERRKQTLGRTGSSPNTTGGSFEHPCATETPECGLIWKQGLC
jgi:hypothetical protein